MKKVLINECYGGFKINPQIMEEYNVDNKTKLRENETLINLVEQGIDIGGQFSRIVVKEIPDKFDYAIEEYDGFEDIILLPSIEHLNELGASSEVISYIKECYK